MTSRAVNRARMVLAAPSVQLVVGGGALAAGTALPGPYRAVLVTCMALLMPGYAMVAACFGRARLDLQPAVTLALSGLVSMALYALMGLALYVASVRISERSTLGATAGLIGLLALVSVIREPPWRPPHLARPPSAESESPRRPMIGAVLFLLGIAIAAMALIAAIRLTPAAHDPSYTELSFAGSSARVGRLLRAGKDGVVRVRLRVANRGRDEITYLVRPDLGGGRNWPSTVLTLRPGRAWTGAVTARVPKGGCVHRVRISLYRDRGRRLLNDLTVWVTRRAALPASCRS